jgi:hypothetical protein
VGAPAIASFVGFYNGVPDDTNYVAYGWIELICQNGPTLYVPAWENASDMRLKKNIQQIGISTGGINIYEFEYVDQVGMEGRYQGVMAQELIGTAFENAVITKGEYYAVDYSKIDVEFKKIS